MFYRVRSICHLQCFPRTLSRLQARLQRPDSSGGLGARPHSRGLRHRWRRSPPGQHAAATGRRAVLHVQASAPVSRLQGSDRPTPVLSIRVRPPMVLQHTHCLRFCMHPCRLLLKYAAIYRAEPAAAATAAGGRAEAAQGAAGSQDAGSRAGAGTSSSTASPRRGTAVGELLVNPPPSPPVGQGFEW